MQRLLTQAAFVGLTMSALSAQAQSAPAASAATGVAGGELFVPDSIGCPWTPLYTPSRFNFLIVNKAPPFVGYDHNGKAFGP